MVSELNYYWIGLFVPVVSGSTIYRCIPIFRPRLADGSNIYLQKIFFDFLFSVNIISYSKLAGSGSGHKKMIFSAELQSY